MKKLKTFFMLVFIIIFAVLVYFITKRIMFNRIEEKFWTAIAEAERNGNYHIIIRRKIPLETEYHQYETICKDGKYYSCSKYSDNAESVDLMIKPDEMYDINENVKKAILSDTYYGYNYAYEFQKLHFFELPRDYYDVTKIENGKYDEKDCYIITMEYYAGPEDGTKEIVAYLNKETYLPYKIEGKARNIDHSIIEACGTQKPEEIYDLIEFDDDVEFPEINLDEYEIIDFRQ